MMGISSLPTGILVTWIIMGLIPAFIAASKGRNFLGWWVYGTLIPVLIPIIHALLISPYIDPRTLKKCPYCAESIKREAEICRYCAKEQPELQARDNPPVTPTPTPTSTEYKETPIWIPTLRLILIFAIIIISLP